MHVGPSGANLGCDVTSSSPEVNGCLKALCGGVSFACKVTGQSSGVVNASFSFALGKK
jgi:hypothetical protein